MTKASAYDDRFRPLNSIFVAVGRSGLFSRFIPFDPLPVALGGDWTAGVADPARGTIDLRFRIPRLLSSGYSHFR